MLDSARLAALEGRLRRTFADRARVTQAVTHASYAAEHATVPQDGLAFVGDAALGLVVAEHLLAAEPAASVGRLTPLRAALVADTRLADWARTLDLGPLLLLGRGAERTGARDNPSVLATTLEALLGALYLEGGLDAVRGPVATLAGWP